MNNSHISFIGAGNMANSLIRGLLNKGVEAQHIAATDIDGQKLQSLRDECGIVTGTMADVAANADVVVLAVKPQVMEQVCAELRPLLSKPDCLIISIAAGITIDALARWLGSARAIVRCMPNTPALVGEGATGLFANANCSATQRQLADAVLGSVGIVCWLRNEQEIDTVTALSGSGPAYFFLLIEAMAQAAVNMGLSEDVARQLAIQTAAGAGRLAASSDVPPAELRRRVTSPGGTTEQALLSFERDGFATIVEHALRAAQQRAAELAS